MVMNSLFSLEFLNGLKVERESPEQHKEEEECEIIEEEDQLNYSEILSQGVETNEPRKGMEHTVVQEQPSLEEEQSSIGGDGQVQPSTVRIDGIKSQN